MKLGEKIFLTVPIIFVSALFLLGIFIPLDQPRVFYNHLRAVKSIQALNIAEHAYAARHPEAGFACNLHDLSDADLIDRVLASGTKAAYYFEIRCLLHGTGKATDYTITALTVKAGMTGKYAFCTDQGGDIWYSESGSASNCLAMRKTVEEKYR
jgi:hypothetical protein